MSSSVSSSATTASASPSSTERQREGLFETMNSNIYLYGFLSVLILIFIVSVAVAYKGYRTRILIRQRIEEALAAGVFIPGFSPGDNVSDRFTAGGRRRMNIGEKPVLTQVWIPLKASDAVVVEKTSWDALLPFSASSAKPKEEPPEPPSFTEWAAEHPINQRHVLIPYHARHFRTGVRSLGQTIGRIIRPRPSEVTVAAPTPMTPTQTRTPLERRDNEPRPPPVPSVPASSAEPPSTQTGQPQSAPTPNASTATATGTSLFSDGLRVGIFISMPNPSSPSHPLYQLPNHSSGAVHAKANSSPSSSSTGLPRPSTSHELEQELPDIVMGYSEELMIQGMQSTEPSTVLPAGSVVGNGNAAMSTTAPSRTPSSWSIPRATAPSLSVSPLSR